MADCPNCREPLYHCQCVVNDAGKLEGTMTRQERYTPLYVGYVGGVVIDEKDGRHKAETPTFEIAEMICNALNAQQDNSANEELVEEAQAEVAHIGNGGRPNIPAMCTLIDRLCAALTGSQP